MTEKKPTGTCSFCGKQYSKGGMSRHLSACSKRKEAIEQESKKRGTKLQKLYQIQVVGQYETQYWLQLEMPASMLLINLDGFLRDIWLECCGHLSAFRIRDTDYMSHPMDEYDDRSMGIPLSSVLKVGDTFHHEYDFGSTTHLQLKIVAEREGHASKRDPITIMARNDPPEIVCCTCGEKPAEYICPECVYEPGQGWYCEECAEEHDYGLEYMLPVVNSPRVGVCGYTG